MLRYYELEIIFYTLNSIEPIVNSYILQRTVCSASRGAVGIPDVIILFIYSVINFLYFFNVKLIFDYHNQIKSYRLTGYGKPGKR